MPSHHKCVVKDCEDRVSARHRFPNPKRFNSVFLKWIKCIGNGALSTLEPLTVYNNYRVCHMHFTADDIYTNNRLKKDAVPSLNLSKPQILTSQTIIGMPRPILFFRAFAKIPSYHKCAVKHCQDSVSARHHFPNPKEFISVFLQWINCIGNEALPCLEPITVYNNYRVCDRHFTEDDMCTNNRLKKDAVPSVNLPSID